MKNIQSIPTKYKRIWYRSKLEVKWKIFFESMDIKSKYEPWYFKLDVKRFYKPDFYFPQYKLFGEVKPHLEGVEKDMKRFLSFSKQYPIVFFIGMPNANTTRYIYKTDVSNVVVFADKLNPKYGPLWSSTYEIGSSEDGFNKHNPFKFAIEIANEFNP